MYLISGEITGNHRFPRPVVGSRPADDGRRPRERRREGRENEDGADAGSEMKGRKEGKRGGWVYGEGVLGDEGREMRGWKERRRVRGDLIEVYKWVKGNNKGNINKVFVVREQDRTCSNVFKLNKFRFSKDMAKN